MNEHFFVYNNQFYPAGTPVISAGSRGLMYGDGLFETIRVDNGKILHADFHFQRFFKGLDILNFTVPHEYSADFFIENIQQLLHKNNHQDHARLRLMAFRSEENLFAESGNPFHYIIESMPLPGAFSLNETGLKLNIFPDGRKSMDIFSNLKSNNYLLSVMAASFAKKNSLDDCLILNSANNVCESAIANVFIIKGKKIITPSLSGGCVEGTARRWFLEKLDFDNYTVEERIVGIEDVLSAEEVFLTNAIHPMRWVGKFRDQEYSCKKIEKIFSYLIKTWRK